MRDPWLLIGDFNEILSPNDKLSSAGSSSGMSSFLQCVESAQLLSITQKGASFTWSNNRKEDWLVMEKLDRALSNTVWTQRSHSRILNLLALLRLIIALSFLALSTI